MEFFAILVVLAALGTAFFIGRRQGYKEAEEVYKVLIKNQK